MTNPSSALADSLVETGYAGFFMTYGEDTINAIWNQPNAPAELAALVMDNTASDEARFLAAEILFYKDTAYPSDALKPTLVPIYAAALSGNFIGVANPWGIPGYLDSAGQHFVGLGDSALPALTALLDNNRRLLFEGSEEATIGNDYSYRVKDFAAYFISQITGLEYTIYRTPAERDAEIEKLKSKLP